MTDAQIELEPVAKTKPDWIISLDDCPELEYLRNSKPSISDDDFEKVIYSASNILAKCPNPEEANITKTGLAIGKVQSGKTLSFTTLIALAAANKYKIIIVIAGTKKPLHKQTHERLIKDLGLNDHPSRIIIYANPTTHNQDSIINGISSDRCLLLTVLKHPTHIQNLAYLLASSEIKNSSRQNATIIIDDEGDEASINTIIQEDNPGRYTPTYGAILSLRRALPLHAYISYTATPQQNLLLPAIDALSPDFAELISPGRGYCGGSVFFGDRMREFVREIDDLPETTNATGIPNSLKFALAAFFVGAAIRHIRTNFKKHSMLIHTTHLKKHHRQTHAHLQQLLRDWKNRLSIPIDTDPAKQDLLKHFQTAYTDIKSTAIFPPEWTKVQTRLLEEINSCEIHMINSLPEATLFDQMSFQYPNNIFVGGNTLGRGLTINDLAVSYMSRTARKSNADTIEQRARWFGYKDDYLDLCRIYLPATGIDWFQGVLEHEDDFWQTLRRNAEQGIEVKDWKRIFKLASTLQLYPTRASVARYRRFKPSEWESQLRPIPNPEDVAKNKTIIDQFFLKNKGKVENIATRSHTFIRNCPLTEVISNLLEKLKMEGTDWESAYMIEYLTRLFYSDRLKTMDVVLMYNGEERERSINAKGEINTLHTGRGETAGYPGDANFHEDKVQLQIYYIKCKDEDRTTTTLSLHMPQTSELDLSLICREGEGP